MQRWFLWLGLVLLALAGAVMWSGQNRLAPIRVPLTHERELRILKVGFGTNHTYSTEPYWKQGARWVLPKKWQGFLGPTRAQKMATPYDSMVVWIEMVHATNGVLAAPKSEQIKARLPEGCWVESANRSVGSGALGCFVFPRFDRTARQVALQFNDGANTYRFTVHNPRPVRTAPWTSGQLPQTNQVSQTKFILDAVTPYPYGASGPNDYLRIKISARTPDDARTGWMYWRLIGFDSSGNWSEPSWGRSSRFPLLLPMLSAQHSPWKIVAEAEEYISAGLLPSPTNGSCVICPLDARAQSLGVIFLMVADRGSYFITNGIVTRQNASAYSPPLATWSGQDNWTLRLVTDKPGIVCLSDRTAGLPLIRARLRERLPHNEGRIFIANLKNHYPVASNLTLGLFPVPLPPTTTNLEAEIIALHPPAEFFIDPPKP